MSANRYRPSGLPTPAECERYHRHREPVRYGDRTLARAMLKHQAWVRYKVWHR